MKKFELPGNVGQAMADEAAGARLRDRQLDITLGQQPRDHVLHRGVALGIDEVRDLPAHALAQFLELALGLARLALDRDAQRNLRKAPRETRRAPPPA